MGSWDGETDVLSAMHYINGSTEFCAYANGNTFFVGSADIFYFCGSSNQIVSEQESNNCSYTIIFNVNCTGDDNYYDNNYDDNYDQGSAEGDVVAGAQTWTCGNRDPQPCDFAEWVVNNWWASHAESFNFASKNWEEYTNAVKSVCRTDIF